MRCIRLSAQALTQVIGDLVTSWVNPSRAFKQNVINFAGPINTKYQHKRKSTTFKSYIYLLICMCTKSVHIALVSELTTKASPSTLRRFISYRDCPIDIYYDNGKHSFLQLLTLKYFSNVSKNQKCETSMHNAILFGIHSSLWSKFCKLMEVNQKTSQTASNWIMPR